MNKSTTDPTTNPTTNSDLANSERSIPQSSHRSISIEIAGAAIFSALSIAFASIASYIPRIPGWYIAWFDPISIIWILTFLIFGIRAGLITTIVGTIGLIPFDPTIWIGPVMKFLSTIWFIILPYLWTKLKSKEFSSETVQKPSNYIPAVILAWILRVIVMTVLNYIILKYMFFMLDDMTLGWMGSEISGIWAVIITLVFINTLQSIFDASIPYLLVFRTPITKSISVY